MAKLNKNDHKLFDIGVKVAKGVAAVAAAAGTVFAVSLFNKDKNEDENQKKDDNKAWI